MVDHTLGLWKGGGGDGDGGSASGAFSPQGVLRVRVAALQGGGGGGLWQTWGG